MDFIAHRINTIKQLKLLDSKYGIEIDIRDNGKELIVVHDPFKKGIKLKIFLKYFKHKLIIANIKSERIEDVVIKIFKKFNINNYFFLDSSFPKIVDLINKDISDIALRISYYEDVSIAKKLENKIKWIWYDTFFGIPKDNKDFKILKKLNYKICLVCPTLHGLNLNINSKRFIELKKSNLIDAICTKEKFFKFWY
jgi:hypothetical protein|tara:strand:+ start:57 stop:644 length:588 start_codon:yes stop_codon:yes gene_type:complete